MKAYPEGCFYGQTAGRSGLANKHAYMFFQIRFDYSGVVLFSFSHEGYEIMKGNGIAEIIIEKCYDVKFIDYGHDDLPETERFTLEFGSSLGF